MDDSVPTAGQTLVIFKNVVLEMSAETFFAISTTTIADLQIYHSTD